MDLAAQLIASGLLVGAPYALAAWAAAVALRSGVLNLALGAFFTAGAYMALEATAQGMPGFYAALPAAAGALLLGLVIERVLVRPLRPWPLAAAVALLGLALAGEAIFRVVWGPADRSVPFRLPVLQIEHVIVAGSELFVTAAVTAAVFGLLALGRRTRMGLAVSAAADNPEIAAGAGVNVERLRAWAFAAGCAAAAAAGAFAALAAPVSPTMERAALFFSLAAVTSGGPTLVGLFGASLALGVLTNSSATYLAPQWAVLVPVVVLICAAALRSSPVWQRAEA
jgi:branched-chain amino acid transport system permease protein